MKLFLIRVLWYTILVTVWKRCDIFIYLRVLKGEKHENQNKGNIDSIDFICSNDRRMQRGQWQDG